MINYISNLIDLGIDKELSWSDRVHDVAVGSPSNIMTLHMLRSLEKDIHHEAAAMRDETIEHVIAISLICQYKLQIMNDIDQKHKDQIYRAYRDGRIRYVD